MLLQPCLLCDTVQLTVHDHILLLNSAADPFVQRAKQALRSGMIILAEDNIATAQAVLSTFMHEQDIQHLAFHDYSSHSAAGTMDVAIMNLLYQPGNAWVLHGIQTAAYALRPGGYFYIVGAKDRGILSTAKRMHEYFGNVETLMISKGQRVICARKLTDWPLPAQTENVTVFANNKLDEGTRLLLNALEVRATDKALDIGCGAGFIGMHIAQLATQGHVTMVDVSLAAVATAQKAVDLSGLTNIHVLPGDGAQTVLKQRFDLIATNPPFHQGGIQTMEIAQRFIREAAQVLQPQGRFYMVANRFLKYEPVLQAFFKSVEEVGGDTRYKVYRSTLPHPIK